MSLQVWLPLNGDLQNLGLSDIIFSQNTVSSYESGKIGKALQVKNSNIDFTVSSLVDAKIFSVAFWYKAITDQSITTNWNKILRFTTKNADGTAGSDFRFESSYGTASSYSVSVHNNTSQSLGSVGHVIVTQKDQWHHICLTHTPEKNLTYLDGALLITHEGAAGTINGRIIIAGSSPYPNGLMNDLRIYDHCLSPKEVKEISKGLVVHYPLNDGIGNENLFRETNLGSLHWSWSGNGGSRTAVSDGEGVILTTTSAANSGSWSCIFFSDSNIKNRIEANTTYTAQVDVWTNVAMTDFVFSIRDGNSLNVLLMNDHGMAVPANVWTHVIWHGTSVNDLPISSQCGYLAGTPATTVVGNIVKLKNFKLEKGSKATLWIPNPTDALYSELGLNDNIVYDCSGYGHNGTKTSTGISCSSDSPKYSSCMDFETSGYINAGTGGKVTDEITISEWVYEDTWTADPHPWSCTQSGGWNIQNNNKPDFLVNVNTVGYVHSTSGDISTPLWTDLSPGWHLFTGTYDGFNVKLYIDGELVANKATGKTDKLPIHYHATNSIFLHREATATGSTGSYAACKLSDFRIYAKALSAEDIKELYETSASIDSHGNMWAYEIQEV